MAAMVSSDIDQIIDALVPMRTYDDRYLEAELHLIFILAGKVELIFAGCLICITSVRMPVSWIVGWVRKRSLRNIPSPILTRLQSQRPVARRIG